MTTAINLPADKFDTAMTFVKPDPAPTRVPLDRLAVLPGFNTRVKDADYSERVAAIAESIAAHGFFDDKPFAVVMMENDETVYIFDGEHRFDAAKQALLDGAEFPEGLPVAFAKDGATVKDLTIHLAHGNNGERLNMVELAAVVRRMQGLGMEKAEIAEALGRTARHVDNLFVLAGANQTVKKAVASGKIAGAEAVKLLRKDPKTAGAKITEAVKKAEERGKAKATPKTMKAADAPKGPKTKTVPLSINFPVGVKMGDALKEMAGMIRQVVEVGEGDLVGADATINFSIITIDREAEAAAAKRAEEKAAAQKAREEAAAKRAEEKAAEAAKRQAEKDALAAAAKGAASAKGKKADAAGKAAGGKKASGGKKADAKPKPISAAEAKKRAAAHTGSDKQPDTPASLAASGGKAAQAAQTPADGDSVVPATDGAPAAGIEAGGPSPDENGGVRGTDDGNNGL